ncbi:MAG: galactose-1-phosphate uridylyltransferase [Aquificota bacterium]|nr:MAG: galactose-1-phosphate uridylyltransferase [Aquificota bacterium]
MSELRYNYLKDTWSIIAVERARRPHDFATHVYEEYGDIKKCPFEPGNEGKTPPEIFSIREPNTKPDTPGWKVRVIPNKYPALRIEETDKSDFYLIYDKKGGFGAHEVIIDTPDHYKHIQDFSVEEMSNMFLTFRERMRALYMDLRIKYVHIFKNHGKDAGKSLVHSHSQLIALSQIPKKQETMINQSRNYFKEHDRCYICDEIKAELLDGSRIVYENSDFLVFCPYASLYPFEIKILPKKHLHDFSTIDGDLLKDLSEATQQAVRRLHKALVNPPFNLILYTSPPVRDNPKEPDYFYGIDKFFHWHIEILPRIAIHAGFELGTDYFINPTPPEEAAKYLREVII